MKRNHNLIITSAETVCVGLVMPFNQEGIRDDPNNPFIHSVHALGQIPWVVDNADTAFAPKDLEGLASYATKTDLNDYVKTSVLTGYYTSAQLNTKLSSKADLAMVANIADKDIVQNFSNKIDQLTALVNAQDQMITGLQTQLNTALAQIKTLVSQSNTTTTTKS